MSLAAAGNLAAVLEQACEAGGWADSIAYVTEDDEGSAPVSWTHADVHEGAARLAGRLIDLGLRRGDVVVVAFDDGIDLVWSFLAIVRAGGIAVPVNRRLAVAELADVCRPCDPRFVIGTDEDAGELATAVGAEAFGVGPRGTASVMPGGDPVTPANVDAGAPAYAQFTSGTTGIARAALHRHSDPLVFQRAFGAPVVGLRAGETALSVSRIFFAYGLGNSVFYPLLAGARAVLTAGRPDPQRILGQINRHDVDVLFAVPSFLARLAELGDAGALSRLRLVISAGEELPGRVQRRIEERSDAAVLDGLGSTEVGQAYASNTVARRRPGTVGRALAPYRLRITGDADAELGPGEEGAVQVAGPTTLLGFLGADEAAVATIRCGEWLRTGDRGSIDGDGFLTLSGRVDDIENIAGIKVDPRVAERRLLADSRVREAAVCAVRDQAGVARLEAFVVTGEDVAATDGLAAELLRLLGEPRPDRPVPRSLRFLSELPRTANGKLRRGALRDGGPAGMEA